MLTTHSDSLWLPILQLRHPEQEDPRRGRFLDFLGPDRRTQPRGLAVLLLPLMFPRYRLSGSVSQRLEAKTFGVYVNIFFQLLYR